MQTRNQYREQVLRGVASMLVKVRLDDGPDAIAELTAAAATMGNVLAELGGRPVGLKGAMDAVMAECFDAAPMGPEITEMPAPAADDDAGGGVKVETPPPPPVKPSPGGMAATFADLQAQFDARGA